MTDTKEATITIDEEEILPAFDGINFELKLIRRDDINVSCIIALLT